MTGKPASVPMTLGRILLLALLVGLVPVLGPATSAQADPADHLILSQIVIKTRAPYTTFGSPSILIVNGTASDLDLSDVYLTDGTTAPNALYYNLPLGDPATSNPGGGNGGDFHARFPAGYTLAAGDTLAIAVNGSGEYQQAYGRLPDFELFEDGNTPDVVPELLEAFPGSINAGPLSGSNVPALSDIGESLILYTWDGSSDLVQDLDYLAWGTYTASLIDKTGVTIGSSTYADDTPVAQQEPTGVPSFRQALRRASDDEGDETHSGGNGISGHDETSEPLTTTWSVIDVAATGHGVPAAPASWYPAAPIVSEATLNPAAPFDGVETVLSVTPLSYSTLTAVSFFYNVDGGSFTELAATLDGDQYRATVPGQPSGAVVNWYCTAENADGAQMTYPSGAPAFVNSYTVASAPQGPMKLLITEVSVDPSEAEFIEIYNPNTMDVDLSDYYLTDAIYYSSSGSDQLYWHISNDTVDRDAVGGGAYGDFTARFPADYVIGAGEVITIALKGSANFENTFGFAPTLELYEDGANADEIPDFRSVFNTGSANSIVASGSLPELEEYWGEPVILFHYTQGDDYVTDIDFVMWRHTVTSYPFTFDKSDIISGSHTYADDTPEDEQVSPAGQVGAGESYTRVVSDSAFQPRNGSNGVDGRNETGEDLETTIQITTWTPGEYDPVEIDLNAKLSLRVPAKTFIPSQGEIIPVEFSTNSSYETKVRIFDLEGRVVRTIYETRRDGAAGLLSAAYWDGRDDHFEWVKSGMYIVHALAIDPATGDQYTETAPVVVATRLSR